MSARDKEPVGWDFEDIRLEQELDENWWYIPSSNVEFSLIEYEAGQRQELPTTVPRKLVVNIVGPLKFFGSGLIVDATSFTIIGCYKNYADSWPSEAQKIEDLLNEQKEAIADKQIEIAGKQWDGKVSGGMDKIDAMWIGKKKKVLDKLQAQHHRESILLADERPHRIAKHAKPLLAINDRMNNCELRRYGQRYQTLFEKFRQDIGSDFKASEDVPEFVRNSQWYGGSGGTAHHRANQLGRMAVEEPGEDGNPGEDLN